MQAINKRIVIIGASGHGKVVADIAQKMGYDDIVFLDDNEKIKSCGKYPVIGKLDSIENIYDELFVAVGNSKVRKMIMEKYSDKKFPVLIHPSACIANDVVIGAGTAVMAGTVINPDSKIGRGVIVNTCSSVDHDCIVGDFSHISVGSHLCGTVQVGENTWIGAGAIVSNNITICENCLVGAGATVVKDINEPGTYMGVPARKKCCDT